MALAVEAAVVAVEIAEAGWSRLRRAGGKDKRDAAEMMEEQTLRLEAELMRERVEKKRLQAALDEYKTVLADLHSKKSGGVQWLENELDSDEGTAEFMERLEQKVNAPEFLDRLRAPQDLSGEVAEDEEKRIIVNNGIMEVNVDVDDPQWWVWITDADMKGSRKNEKCVELDGEDDYVMVEQDDIIDGVALVVARYIITHPDFQDMSAQELQKAMTDALHQLHSKSSFKRFWDWGKFLYKASRWATAAFSVYRHPVMVKAILLAIWSSSRLILGVPRL